MMHKVTLTLLALSLSLIFAALGSFSTDMPAMEQTVATAILHNDPTDTKAGLVFVNLDQVLGDMVTSNTDTASSTEAEDTEVITPLVSDFKEVTVKIRCTQTTDTHKRSISGTGFLINPTGVIMTNAHVAQFLLLKDLDTLGTTECTATVGTDESTSFALGLLYISPTWLLEHASLIASAEPKGTGENDFALVHITNQPTDGADFPFLPPATNPLSKTIKGKTVTLVGYPRQEDKTAPQLITTTTITDLYTFGGGYADILTLASSTLGYKGASGGPVIDEYGRAIGIMTTKDAGTTILNAITMAHVDRGLRSEIGFDLASYLQGNVTYKAELFNQTVAPILQEILAEYLNQ